MITGELQCSAKVSLVNVQKRLSKGVSKGRYAKSTTSVSSMSPLQDPKIVAIALDVPEIPRVILRRSVIKSEKGLNV